MYPTLYTYMYVGVHDFTHYTIYIYIILDLSVLGLCLRINDWFVCLDLSDYFVSFLFY